MNEKMTALVNDQRLMDLARYKTSNGMLEIPTADAIAKEFTAMKKRILAGKTTISKLEERIFKQYGVQEDVKMPAMSSNPVGFGAPPPDMAANKEKKQIGFTVEDDD